MRVSVIIPLYNEEKYIEGCIQSLINQTFPRGKMEWILVDGCSTDRTVQIIKEYAEDYPIVLLKNEKRKTPYALNLGIERSSGEYIIRLDAHAYFPADYIEKCVHYLDTTDAANVGGIAVTEANGFVGRSIAKMLSSKFGVGGSDFRIGQGNKYVDTVPFGAFRREIFDRAGLFNTELLRSEDNEMNARIRKSGGKIWLAEDITFKYFCRDTVKGVLKMALQNGNALFFTMKTNVEAMRIRHMIPLLFVVSLIGLSVLSAFVPAFGAILLAEAVVYLLLDIWFSFFCGAPETGVITFWLFPLFHIVYGIGSLLSFLKIKCY